MPNYAIRIELNGAAPPGVYARLHEEMAKRNVSRTILGDDGVVYVLPHATYVGNSARSATQVRDDLMPTVQAIWWDCDLIVFHYDDAAWRLTRQQPRGLLAA